MIPARRTRKVGGKTAQAVTFEVVNLDQYELDPNAPRVRAEIVLVDKMLQIWVEDRIPVRACLLLGYSNDAPQFAEQLDEFHRFVERVKFVPPEGR